MCPQVHVGSANLGWGHALRKVKKKKKEKKNCIWFHRYLTQNEEIYNFEFCKFLQRMSDMTNNLCSPVKMCWQMAIFLPSFNYSTCCFTPHSTSLGQPSSRQGDLAFAANNKCTTPVMLPTDAIHVKSILTGLAFSTLFYSG